MSSLPLTPVAAGALTLTAPSIVNQAFFSVVDYGAIGNGSHDDTVAFQACITDAIAAGGWVFVPAPTVAYVLSSTINIFPAAGGANVYLDITSAGPIVTIKWAGADNTTIFHSRGWKNSSVHGLSINIPSPRTGVVAWDVDTRNAADGPENSSSRVSFYDCEVSLSTGTANCVGWRLGHGSTQTGTDISFINWSNCFVSANVVNGHIGWVSEHQNVLVLNWYGGGGYYLSKLATNIPTAGALGAQGGDGMGFYGFGGSHNDVDFEFKNSGSYVIVGGRYEVGKKFLVVANGTASISVSVKAVRLSGYVPGDNCVIDWANITYNGGRPGSLTIDDLTADASDYTAAFITYQGVATRPSKLTVRNGSIRSLVDPVYTLVSDAGVVAEFDNVQQLNSSVQPVVMFSTGVRALTYSASITPKRGGGIQTIVATNGTAFTINAPTLAAKQDRLLVLDIKNSSGGALGVITWDAVFLLAGAFTNPTNGKRRTISFYYDGTNWVETNRAAADI